MGCDHGAVSWDEGFAERYDEWSAPMTADVGFYVGLEVEALYGGFAREPFTEDSREYVFVTRPKPAR